MVRKIMSTKTLTKFVMFSIMVIVIYTISEFVCSIVFGVSHDVLTDRVYKFFGFEIAACGFIKIFKIKRGDFNA